MSLDVLIVDDSSAIRKIFQRVLRSTEFPFGDFHEAGDGKEALKVLENADIGIVFSDINMPNMDGLEFVRQVRSNRNWKDLPIVMVTTEGGQSKVMEAVELGAAGYIRKPFTNERVMETLLELFRT